jgi:hypothetical protein
MFEKKMLKRMFGSKKGDWENSIMRSVNFYFSANIIRVIKSRRMRWVGHVSCMAEMRNAYKC